jgi:hypothetical protein
MHVSKCAFGKGKHIYSNVVKVAPSNWTTCPKHRDASLKGRSLQKIGCSAADLTQSSSIAETLPLSSTTTNGNTIPKATEWELDFCSRPLLDERGKKIWELIICDPDRTFEFAQYFPNNKINSGELKRAIEVILSQPGAVRPESIRFFRGQMQTIITRALTDLGIKATASRRCFTLLQWLEERVDSVYKLHPGYNEKASTLFTLDLGPPEDLPDALRGESWSFVQLPLGYLKTELKAVEDNKCFGCVLDFNSIGLGSLGDDTLVPGVAVYSRRAAPMAAWTDGMELSGLTADVDRAFLILETGFNQRWRYGSYKRTPETTAEAEAWEEAKKQSGGVHFLAVMENEEADDCAGLWLLLDRPMPPV